MTESTSQSQTSSFPGFISEEDITSFQNKGYLAWNGILSPEEVADARSAIRNVVNQLAGQEGKASLNLQGENGNPVFQSTSSRCFFQLEAGSRPDTSDLDALELKVRKLMWFEEESPVFHQIAFDHPALRAVREALLGEGAKMFQSMALIKPPFHGSEKPWHQDNAYFKVTPLDAILGVWIALDHATVENGCMHVLEGGHRAGPLRHHHDKDCEIVEGRLQPENAVPIELEPGGVLFFYGMLPHFTPANKTPKRRRALQFHYHAAHAVHRESEAYDRIFAEPDGTPASCEAARIAGV